MKKSIFIALILLTGNFFCAKAQTIFETGDFSSALTKAKAANKKVFVDCYTSWCGPCKQLALKVFPDTQVGEFMNSEFVCFKIDMEKGEGIQMMNQFKVKAFPTLLILDSNGSEINRIIGATLDTKEFIAKIKEASDRKNSVAEFKKKYEEDINYADGYLKAIFTRGIPEEIDGALEEVFKKRSPEQRYTVDNFKIYNYAIKSIEKKPAELIIADRENAIKYLGDEKFRNFINDKVSEKIVSLYMGDIKAGVNRDECMTFEKYGSKYPDVLNSHFYKYFACTYQAICDKEIDKFLEISLGFFANGTKPERENIRRFTYRIASTAGKKESLIKFYENCRTHLTDAEEISGMSDNIDRMKSQLNQK